jgi:hypothetical protein
VGLQCGLAMPGPSDFNRTRYVDGDTFTNFKRIFSVLDCYLGAILVVEVLTFYENYSRAARVLINGQQVASIPPMPASQYVPSLQLCQIFVRETFLINRGSPGSIPITGWQQLEIDPIRPAGQPASPDDALVIGNWHVLFYH